MQLIHCKLHDFTSRIHPTVAARITGCLHISKDHLLQLNLTKTELLDFPATATVALRQRFQPAGDQRNGQCRNPVFRTPCFSWPDDSWVYRDQQHLIKMCYDFSVRKEAVRKTLIRIHALKAIDNNLFSKYSNIPIDHTLSLKLFKYVNYFRRDFEKVNFTKQLSFVIIVFKMGPPKLIGPIIQEEEEKRNNNNKRKKEKHCPDHTEPQIICATKEYITKNKKIIEERQIEFIINNTTNNPCIGRKCHDSCIIQLSNFCEEMNKTYNIKVYNIFQNIYGATGRNIINEVKDNLTDPLIKNPSSDPLIRNILQWLKEMINKEHNTSKFIFSQINQVQKKKKTILHYISTEVKEITERKSQEFLSSLKDFIIEFPSDPMTLDELKSFGGQQADKMKEHVKQIFNNEMKSKISEEFSEEISGKVCLFFYRKWCELVDNEYLFNEEYLEVKEKYKVNELLFKYLKLCDVINTFTVNFAYINTKVFTKTFILKRVEELKLEYNC